MSEMEMWSGEVDVTQLKALPYVCKGDSVEFLNAEASGIFLTDMTTGKMVDEGDEIGQIVSPLEGKILSRASPHATDSSSPSAPTLSFTKALSWLESLRLTNEGKVSLTRGIVWKVN